MIVLARNQHVEPQVGRVCYTSYRDLGGRCVEKDEIITELSLWPLDAILRVLARISRSAVQLGDTFQDPRHGGQYLARAIVDDFPALLPRAHEMYAPGRVPITRGRHLFIHEHNLAALASMALAHCRQDRQTPEVTATAFGRILRLLLILNDHLHDSAKTGGPDSLTSRRDFARSALYCDQFNNWNGGLRKMLVELARLDLLLSRFVPSHFPAFDKYFEERLGFALSEYIDLATLLAVDVFGEQGMWQREASPWFRLAEVRPSQGGPGPSIERLFRSLAQTPAQFGTPSRSLFEFQDPLLRPIIEARTGEFVIPVLSLFFARLFEGPFLLLKCEGSRAGEFGVALGHAYEEYAQGLVQRLGVGDRPGPWECRSNIIVGGGEIDSLLWRRGACLAFEHKAKGFAAGIGKWRAAENAIGPSDREIEQAAFSEADTTPTDDAAVTQPLQQFSRSGESLMNYLARSFGPTTRVFPVITSLAPYHIDEWVRLGYIEPLIRDQGLFEDDRWAQPQWLRAWDLEALAAVAQHGLLDLQDLMETKTREAAAQRFDTFLAEHFGSIFIDPTLFDHAQALLQRSEDRWFAEKAK